MHFDLLHKEKELPKAVGQVEEWKCKPPVAFASRIASLVKSLTWLETSHS